MGIHHHAGVFLAVYLGGAKSGVPALQAASCGQAGSEFVGEAGHPLGGKQVVPLEKASAFAFVGGRNGIVLDPADGGEKGVFLSL